MKLCTELHYCADILVAHKVILFNPKNTVKNSNTSYHRVHVAYLWSYFLRRRGICMRMPAIGHAHSFNTAIYTRTVYESFTPSEPAAASCQASLEFRVQGPIYETCSAGMSLLLVYFAKRVKRLITLNQPNFFSINVHYHGNHFFSRL